MSIRSCRSALHFESLEQRALLAAVMSPVEQIESARPAEPVETVELFEHVEQCEPPITVISPWFEMSEDFMPWLPPVKPDATWCEAVPHEFLSEYDAFLAEHPDWLSEHGADGIQLMVIAPSMHLPWIELSTPAAAWAFDAWYAQTYLQVSVDGPPLWDFDEEWLPVEFSEQHDDGAAGFEEESLPFATLADVALEPRAAALEVPAVQAATAIERPWLPTGFAFAQFAESLTERPASSRAKRRGMPPRI